MKIIMGNQRGGKSQFNEKIKGHLLALGARVTKDENSGEHHYYQLELQGRSYLFISKGKPDVEQQSSSREHESHNEFVPFKDRVNFDGVR